MSQSLVTALSVICVFILINTCTANDCKMADFPVMPNFQPDKYAGKWYEIKWIIEPWIPPEWNYMDYFATFTQEGADYDKYWMGRGKESDPTCVSGQGALYSLGENGKYIYNRKYNSTARMNSTYWIIDTDYDNYALTYGCREMGDNGVCLQPDCWLWTRVAHPDDKYMKHMEAQLPQLCVTEDMLLTTKQIKDCSKDSGVTWRGNLWVSLVTPLLPLLASYMR